MSRESSPKNRKPFFRFIKCMIRIFKRKPEYVYLGETPENACIYISNHSTASGPATYELYFPTPMRFWGTYEMCGNFKSRWKYLNHTYFHRKKKRNKLTSFFLATILTPIMALFYKGMRIMPTYPDLRLTKTFNESIAELKNGVSILIFPENSSDGYHDILTEYYGGFWLLAKRYNETTGNDINIVNMYYHKKSNRVIVSEPRSYLELSERFRDRDELTKFFCDDANGLYTEYILPTVKAKNAKTHGRSK